MVNITTKEQRGEQMISYAPVIKNKNKYYETIIDNIRLMIVHGELQRGEKIPSERELADLFNVSRVPVREALKILEYMGVLENLSGDGLYVRDMNLNDLIEKLDFSFTVTTKTILDLFEVRVSLESTACYHAALRRTNEDIQLMQKTIDEMRNARKNSDCTEKDIQDIRTTSHNFHIAVVKASKNSVLSSVYENLFELLDISKQYTIKTSGSNFDSLLAHEVILEKIIQQDSDGARERMMEHLSTACEKLIDNLNEHGILTNKI